MATLLIEKNSLNVWAHTPSDFQPYILTQFYAKSNGDSFMVFEFSGVQRGSYHYSDISIKDGANPLETGFTSIKQVMLRLEELKYVGFEFDGDFIAAEVISSDSPNMLEEGTDGKLFVEDAPSDSNQYARKNAGWEVVSSGVITTNTNITSSSLTTQDVAGFVAYINGLVLSFAVAANEIRTYTVTDTGQKFEILLRGRSFGGSEPDILTSDVLEIESNVLFNPFQPGFDACIIRPSGQGLTTFVVTNMINNPWTATGTLEAVSEANEFVFVAVKSAAPAGSSTVFTTTSQTRFRTYGELVNKLIFSYIFQNADAAFVANARFFVGYVAQGTVIGNTNPSSQINIFGFGADTGDSNVQFIHNDNTGTASKIDLGVNFPANTSVDKYFSEVFFDKPNSKLYYRLTRLLTGHSASGIVTTNLPVGLTNYDPYMWRNNGTTALEVKIRVGVFISSQKTL